MAGLIELLGAGTGDPNKDAAINQGILQMGLQMMQSRGSLGQALGQGGMAGIQGYNQTQDAQFQNLMRAQQQKQWEDQNRQAAMQQKLRDLAPQYQRSAAGNAMAGGGGPTPENAQRLQTAQPSFDMEGFARAAMGSGALDLPQLMQVDQYLRKDTSPLTVKEGETLLNRKTLKPIFSNPKAETLPNDVREYQFARSQGYPGTFEQFQLAGKRAGASQVNVKTDVKTGESLAARIGPMMEASTGQAEAAVKQADAAQRVINAIDSNKVFTGPGANIKLRGTQILDALGAGGRDDAEKLANTRQAIRGLAELTLQGRQQMKGQGAITESEGRLAEKAMSGDISDMTAGELKQLAKASERAARFNYAQHERKMKEIRNRPEFQGISGFYEAPQMPSEPSRQVKRTGTYQGKKIIEYTDGSIEQQN